MIEIPKGTLVQIRQSAVREGANYAETNNHYVTKHGYLWTVVDVDKVNGAPAEEDVEPEYHLYLCTSLATGEDVEWFRRELRAPNDEGEEQSDA